MTAVRSNIFGDSFFTSESIAPFSTSSTNAAGQLIDKLKWIADSQIVKLNGAADWLGISANAGQNASSQSFVRQEWLKPAALTNSSILSGWTSPAMPTLPSFPVLPADLKVDMSAFRTTLDAEINRLKTSWLVQAIPTTPTDISRMDQFLKDVLNGSDEATIQSKITNLESILFNALSNITAHSYADLTTALATMRTAVASAESGLQPLLDAALAVARNDTANIAWARARDQAAREAARLEIEAAEEYAARGFSMPGGVLNAVAANARQATQNAASKAAADQAVLAQGQYLEIAKTAISSWMQVGDFKLKSEIAAFTSAADQIFRYSSLELDANRERAKTAIANLGLRIDFTKFAGETAERYRNDVANNMNGLINAYANLAGTEMQYLARIAEAQRANLTSLVDYYRASLAHAEMGFKAAITNNDNDIRWAEIAAQFISRAVSGHVQASAAAGEMYAKVAGMAMSGLNGVASVTSSS